MIPAPEMRRATAVVVSVLGAPRAERLKLPAQLPASSVTAHVEIVARDAQVLCHLLWVSIAKFHLVDDHPVLVLKRRQECPKAPADHGFFLRAHCFSDFTVMGLDFVFPAIFFLPCLLAVASIVLCNAAGGLARNRSPIEKGHRRL